MIKNWKIILGLAIPSIASFASMTLTGTINLILVGQLGAMAIAIVGVSNIIMYNTWALFSGVGHTINYLVAQNYGSNTMKKGIERTQIALYICAIAGILIFFCGIFAADWILRVVTGSELYLEDGSSYLKLRFYAMIFGVFVFTFHGFLRGIGDTRTPMVISIVANLVMIFLTYALTYGKLGFPEFGLVGAGWAFLIGECIAFLACLYIYFIKLHTRYQTRTKVPFQRKESGLIIRESSKLGIQEFALSMAMIIFTMFVARLGTNALAANEISLNVMALGFMPAFAFGTTATILVGQELGKGNPLLARSMGTQTAIIGSLFMLGLGIIMFIFAKPIALLFTSEPEVYQLATYLILIAAFWQLFDGLLNFYAGALRGIGQTTFLLITSLALGWFFFIPTTYILTFTLDFGSVGAWISLYLFLTLFALAVMIRFYRMDWLSLQIKSTEDDALVKGEGEGSN